MAVPNARALLLTWSKNSRPWAVRLTLCATKNPATTPTANQKKPFTPTSLIGGCADHAPHGTRDFQSIRLTRRRRLFRRMAHQSLSLHVHAGMTRRGAGGHAQATGRDMPPERCASRPSGISERRSIPQRAGPHRSPEPRRAWGDAQDGFATD